MTSMNHIVIDVSSDEEDDILGDYSNWLDGVLEAIDEKPKNNEYQKSSNSSDPTVEIADGDDDCVVLDDDPFKTTAKETSIDTCDSDEVLFVGQKGEIACRDFPHPRHACAKYPFKSTSHQQYCEMCHCYVCDIRAPCANWCISFSSIDHCHADDKEQIWKNQRESIRTGKRLPRPVSKPSLTIPQLHRVSQPLLLQNSSSPLNKIGIRPCSTSTRVATHPTTYTSARYRTGQSRTFPQNPSLHPHAAQVFQKPRSGSYNGNPNPLAVSSSPFKWSRRPSRGVYSPENSKDNIAQAAEYTCNAPPMPLQGNPQPIVSDFVSTVPESHSKVYARRFSRKMHSGDVQTSAVPSETLHPPANQNHHHQQQQQQQQQRSGISNDKVLSEFEDWLMDMDNSTLTESVCPLSGQDNAATFTFDFETFLE